MIFYFHRSPKRQQDFSQNPESEEVHFEIVIPSELGQLGKENTKYDLIYVRKRQTIPIFIL